MPRLARLDAPGVLHHIIIRGIERRKIFRDDKDKDNFVDRLSIHSFAGNPNGLLCLGFYVKSCAFFIQGMLGAIIDSPTDSVGDPL